MYVIGDEANAKKCFEEYIYLKAQGKADQRGLPRQNIEQAKDVYMNYLSIHRQWKTRQRRQKSGGLKVKYSTGLTIRKNKLARILHNLTNNRLDSNMFERTIFIQIVIILLNFTMDSKLYLKNFFFFVWQ